ncbi:hypothetical protein A3C89_02460 [Candidatus Kaiserbacteria bacterium RIFCSPHIGHO2_02_FULL_50_50]|uniref:Uncharacterized protein n=1 Tax=Candidatus Kaiserbacteria bacterium RIFCSPHIGHO2_02_FULL_50_50 TaxID=1798492 RepID=A0A1F6DD65_9BACT|nr:MAG: hypothetical protein A3C89_02460 [Candidatus Kaiserbacteria bacterium RIFCSPHIGHO2_02_FULL_50_50]OGG88192.1 MAG: hypothetical protein A3G62_00345 [Candidatus Kaiserbacteria bacterium RIFCSPLOWO2_12_FULL_50_10]
MLDKHEMAIRSVYYADIFGGEKITRSPFPEHLWPVMSYPEKIKGLTDRGFKDPHKMIASFPSILGLALENIDAKIKGLTDRGFKNPKGIITKHSPILGFAIENIDAKISGLIARGFKDPHKMIASFPPILGLAFENIDAKIKGLTDRGLKDVQEKVVLSPQILSYSFENIDRKMRLCRRLGGNYQDFLDYGIIFAGMSPKNYIPILRKCRELEFSPSPKNVFKIYRAKSF